MLAKSGVDPDPYIHFIDSKNFGRSKLFFYCF
jgi:hypothetical protein